jgi:hypothetical protein
MLGKTELINEITFLVFIGFIACKPKAENKDVLQVNADTLRVTEPVQTSRQKEKKHDYRSIKQLDYGKVEVELKDTSQFYLLKGECAVTIMPDTTWLREYRETMPEDAWYSSILQIEL